MTEQCATCRFAVNGTCKRYPNSTSPGTGMYQRPIPTNWDDWCGEWQAVVDVLKDHPATILAHVRDMCAKHED